MCAPDGCPVAIEVFDRKTTGYVGLPLVEAPLEEQPRGDRHRHRCRQGSEGSSFHNDCLRWVVSSPWLPQAAGTSKRWPRLMATHCLIAGRFTEIR